MEIPRSDKITKQKVPTPHAADDMPLWDGHFLIVGKCSEGKVRNVKKYFIRKLQVQVGHLHGRA